MKSDSRAVRLLVAIALGAPSYAVFALIRDFPFSQMTPYSYRDYSLTATISLFILFEAQFYKSRLLNNRWDWKEAPVTRLSIELLSSLVLTVVIVTIGYSFLYLKIWDMAIYQPSLYLYISLCYFISLCFMGYVNIIPIMNEWKNSLMKAEQLKKENLSARLEALRTQLSPHFFFNNLSLINALIDQDSVLAKDSINRLSEVFRYILDHKHDEIVKLEDELTFIKNYCFLLKARFETKFDLDLSIDDRAYWIPPMTLQLLIENAVKHNTASNDNPLKVKITQIENRLIVENKISSKVAAEPSGLGLDSILKRYEALTDEPVIISADQETFTVELPLLIYENRHH
ncbi:MAG: histidine kinase [Cyclobacteriaceae bacterium]